MLNWQMQPVCWPFNEQPKHVDLLDASEDLHCGKEPIDLMLLCSKSHAVLYCCTAGVLRVECR